MKHFTRIFNKSFNVVLIKVLVIKMLMSMRVLYRCSLSCVVTLSSTFDRIVLKLYNYIQSNLHDLFLFPFHRRT